MKNAIVTTSIGNNPFKQYALPSMELYCSKYDIDLIVISEFEYNIGVRDGYNFVTYEKNQTYKYFDDYDRILRIDIDVLITPNCPNVFDLPKGYVYATFEDVGSRAANRRNRQMVCIKQVLGDLPEWKEGYFNSGVMMCDKEHRDIFKFDLTHLQNNTQRLGDMREQNYVNWNVNNLKFPIKNWGYKYNHMSMFEEPWHGKDRRESYIIHYAGTPIAAGKNPIKTQSDFEHFNFQLNETR